MKSLLLPVFCIVFCLPASAISFPESGLQRSFADTTLNSYPTSSLTPVVKKKGLFSRLKETVARLFLKTGLANPGANEKKRKLTLVACLLVVVGLGFFALTASLLWLLVSAAGLVTGIVALTIKEEPATVIAPVKTQMPAAPRKKSWFVRNLIWIIPVIAIVGLVAAWCIGWSHAHF